MITLRYFTIFQIVLIILIIFARQFPIFMANIEINRNLVRTLRSKRLSALRELREVDAMSQPLLDDPDYILLPSVYEIFKSLFPCKNDGMADVYTRKKFLFVCLCLYSPRTLHGSKIKAGLRDRILALLGLSCCTAISDNCRNILTMYEVYRDFRVDVNRVLSKIYEAYPGHIILSETDSIINIKQ